jgi:hypothetical protein
VIKQDKKTIEVEEAEGRKALLVRTYKPVAFHSGEICAFGPNHGLDISDIKVLETDRPLKLEVLPLPPLEPAFFLNKIAFFLNGIARIAINPVGVSYRVDDNDSFAKVTVLKKPGPIRSLKDPISMGSLKDPIEMGSLKDSRTFLVFPTPTVTKPSAPYKITDIEVYTDVIWVVNSDEDRINCDKLLYYWPIQCYLADNAPLFRLGFSFLNDKGEWEPLMDFEVV